MTKLKHFAFSFALRNICFGCRCRYSSSGSWFSSLCYSAHAKTDISQSKDLSINWKNTSKEYLFEGKIIEPEVIVTQTITENGTTKTVTWTNANAPAKAKEKAKCFNFVICKPSLPDKCTLRIYKEDFESIYK